MTISVAHHAIPKLVSDEYVPYERRATMMNAIANARLFISTLASSVHLHARGNEGVVNKILASSIPIPRYRLYLYSRPYHTMMRQKLFERRAG